MEADKVVLVADTPEELEAQVRASGPRGVATMRAPAEMSHCSWAATNPSRDAALAMAVLDQSGFLDQFTSPSIPALGYSPWKVGRMFIPAMTIPQRPNSTHDPRVSKTTN